MTDAFGWDLPPGTTHAMIDRHFGGPEEGELGCECGSPRAVPGYDCPACGEYVMDEGDLREAAEERRAEERAEQRELDDADWQTEQAEARYESELGL